ncbi:6454_t:CDS:2 [Funneliformis mosseae]|uniref:6454_t:CDS:1 n=1 Tax=Funneliformis mosseae TaxID=27381 RepID=A0A9N8VFJ7_FUNMO|nr:6454_t:CDS:2 [Funneliformis mosseae]
MLLAKYTDDIVSLVEKLSSVFDHSNSTMHHLFENASEINEKGIKNILSFYEFNKSRFQQILMQNVYKTESQITYTLSSLQQVLLSDTSHSRKIRCITTNVEKAILDQLFEFEEKPPETVILKVLSKLQAISSDWTAERVKQIQNSNTMIFYTSFEIPY